MSSAGGVMTAWSRLRHATFQSNPRYRLVEPGTLSSVEREALGGSLEDPDCHALLCPQPGSPELGVKAVSTDVAALFGLFATPGSLPEAMASALGGRVDGVLAELVADGILTIEIAGDFLSGPAAMAAFDADVPRARPAGALARRSIEALRYGERLSITDRRRLSARLYQFGRVPVTPRLEEEYADWAAIAVDLGPDGGRRLSGPHRRRWMLASPEPTDGWLSWRAAQPARGTRSRGTIHKLYVSPTRDAIREVLSTVSGMVRDSDAIHMKVGADVWGVCRPDKLVVYFRDREELLVVAADLERALEGCPAHGVPFTAELAGDGLLSAGVDPPPDPYAPAWLELQSWRLWVTNRLAAALLAAKAARVVAMPPWAFAVARLRLDDVDTETWAPTDATFDHW